MKAKKKVVKKKPVTLAQYLASQRVMLQEAYDEMEKRLKED